MVAIAGSTWPIPRTATRWRARRREPGGLDALVNNAGMLGPSPQPPLLDYPLDALETVYRINVWRRWR